MAGVDVSITGCELEVSLLQNCIDVDLVQQIAIDISIETPTIEIELSCYPGFTLPPGGQPGDILVKLSDTNGDVGWVSRADFFQSYFDGLDSYTDDAAAVSDGLTIDALYWVATGSDSNIPGTLRRVTTV